MIGHSNLNSKNNLKLFYESIRKLPISIFRQFKRLKKSNYDIVHLNSATLISSGIASLFARKKIIWHIREGGNRNFRKWLTGKIIDFLADKIICISPLEQKSYYLQISKKSLINYNSIDFNKLDLKKFNYNTERSKLGLSKNDFILITLGGVNPRKGILQILESLSLLPENIKLIVLGKKFNYPIIDYKILKKYQKIKNIFSKNNMLLDDDLFYYKSKVMLEKLSPKRVLFFGEVENVGPYIAASDLLISAGQTPHFSRPLYEAWAMKKPVAINNYNGLELDVNNHFDGIIINNYSSYELADKIKLLIGNKEKCQRLGENGYIKSVNRMNPVSSANKIMDCYLSVLNNKLKVGL